MIGFSPFSKNGAGSYLGLNDTPDTFNPGRVLFDTASGVSNDDNLKWDNTEKQLLLGGASIGSVIVVKCAGKAGATSGIDIRDIDGVSLFFVRDDGAVGINQNNPTRRFHLVSSGSTAARFELGTSAALAIELANSDLEWEFGMSSSEAFTITDATNSKTPITLSKNGGKIWIDGSGVILREAGSNMIEIDAGIGFFNTSPQAQQAHIADADGTLADITTKFNALLAGLEGYGLFASS